VYGSGDLWVAEVTLTYGTKPYAAVLIFKLRDGKIRRRSGTGQSHLKLRSGGPTGSNPWT
jgi:hypothetical protein